MPPVMERTISDQPVEAGDYAEEEAIPSAPLLTVGDGFRFGCGLILAGVAFSFLLVIATALSVLLAILLDLPLPFNLLG